MFKSRDYLMQIYEILQGDKRFLTYTIFCLFVLAIAALFLELTVLSIVLLNFLKYKICDELNRVYIN